MIALTLRELYTESVAEGFDALIMLIEFLIFEKEVLTFDSDISELDLYYKPNNKEKMNKFLLEYQKTWAGD